MTPRSKTRAIIQVLLFLVAVPVPQSQIAAAQTPSLIPAPPPPPPPPPQPPAKSPVTDRDFGYTIDQFADTFNGLRTGIRLSGRSCRDVRGASYNFECAFGPTEEQLAVGADSSDRKVKYAGILGFLEKGDSAKVNRLLAGCEGLVTLLTPEVQNKAELISSLAASISQSQSGKKQVRQVGQVEYQMSSTDLSQYVRGSGGALMFSCSAKLRSQP
jgi:hypothetical protein